MILRGVLVGVILCLGILASSGDLLSQEDDIKVGIYLDFQLEGDSLDGIPDVLMRRIEDYYLKSHSLTFVNLNAQVPDRITFTIKLSIDLYGQIYATYAVQNPLIWKSLPTILPQISFDDFTPPGSRIIQFNVFGMQIFDNILTGLSLYSLERCAEAEVYFAEAERIILESYYALEDILQDIAFYRANCLLLVNRYDEAIPMLLTLIQDNGLPTPSWDFPDQLSVRTNLAWAYLQLGKKQEAFQLIDEWIDFVSCDRGCKWQNQTHKLVDALVSRAKLRVINFEYDAAILDTATAIQTMLDYPKHFSSSDLAALYTERGQMVLLTYEWDAVLADYNKALELEPNYADAYFYRGVLFYTQGPRERALEDFRRYLELAPEGEHADESAKYIESIEVELEALGQ